MLGADLAHIEIIQAVFADFQFFLKRRSIAGYVTDEKTGKHPKDSKFK